MALAWAWKQMSWFYYQYLLVPSLHMLEPWERTVFNSMLVSVVGMVLYTGYVFMPQHILAILHYFETVQCPRGARRERFLSKERPSDVGMRLPQTS